MMEKTIKDRLAQLQIESLNEMQMKMKDAFSHKPNMLLLAPTGSGKTIAYLMPLSFHLKNIEQTQALLIAPSRELCIQIEDVFKKMKTGLKVNCCYGGHERKTELNNLKHPPALLIGTPGRLADLMYEGHIDLRNIRTLILDEFDKSLEFGFQKEMTYIIGGLPHLEKRILISATMLDEIPVFTGISHPYTMDFATGAESLKLTYKSILSDDRDKLITLYRLLCMIGNKATLVFCNHRESVERISQFLHEQKIEHALYHGGLEQDVRERTLIKFRNGSLPLMITTDLAARGLDIPEIENIVHYHMPTTEDAYIHRNGRTARMNAKGTVYLILSEGERPSYLKEIPLFEKLAEKSLPPKKSEWVTLFISAGKKDKINKTDIVGFLHQKAMLTREEVGMINVLDRFSYVAVSRNKVKELFQKIGSAQIKKRGVKIEIAR